MNAIEQGNQFLYQKKEEEKSLKLQLAKQQQAQEAETYEAKEYQEALDILTNAVGFAHQEAKGLLEDLATEALQAVYGDEYEFKIEYGTQRGRTSATPIILRSGTKVSPRDEVGGGVLDVASFALRLGCWVLKEPASSNVFLLDEPFRFVSRDRIQSVVNLMHGVCDMLGIQIIMVSHNEDLIAAGKKAFEVKNTQGISQVVEVI